MGDLPDIVEGRGNTGISCTPPVIHTHFDATHGSEVERAQHGDPTNHKPLRFANPVLLLTVSIAMVASRRLSDGS